jgi:hypothetical protein
MSSGVKWTVKVSRWFVVEEGRGIQLSSPWPRSSTLARAKVVAIQVLPRT